ncbi:hydrophobin [Moniliophthora roreri MCA 2997]|uniref:Hydrophobin n=1 Tax=Moniliophthora roreri (strain MCA 2997) TaxID=1381753 RepID=V2WJN4_MONRO|nr:hydrophobin [Moniliophthora roreri MCA 2997]
MYKLFTLAALVSVVVAAPGGHDGRRKGSRAPGVVVQDLNIPIGVQCNPISVIGVGGNSCTQQPVCCDNNNFNGVVAIGCTPINVNL